MAHLEREIKLHLPSRELERLMPLAPRRRSVSSVYYDTPDQALRRAGVALRLRLDGRSWLQTLKSESAPHAGLAARAEWELPVRRRALELGAFPGDEIERASGIDLQRLARRLRTVFETRFTRCSGLIRLDGRAIAELSIDRGYIAARARREPISEVELELISGDPRALLRYAERLGLALAYESKAERGYRLAAGLPRAPRKWRMPEVDPAGPPGRAFAVVFAAALMQAGINAAGMLASSDPEYLHQLRVGLRRLRSALRSFSPLLADSKPIRRALRRLTPVLGTARDWDVLVQRHSRLPGAVRRSRGAARRAALDAVASPEFQRFLFRSLRWLQSEPWSTGGESLARFAPRQLDRLHGNAVRAAGWRSAKRRHKLRIRIKRLRYACEFFAPCFPQSAVLPYLRRLRRLQDMLGELNDIAVARRLLRQTDASLDSRERRFIGAARRAWVRFEKLPPYWRRPG